MNKRKNYFYYCLTILFFIFALSFFPNLTPFVESVNSHATIPTPALNIYYGRNKLASESAVYVGAYDAICNGFGSTANRINLNSYSLSEEEFSKILNIYMLDHPEHYWVSKRIGYSPCQDTGTVAEITNPNYLTGFDNALFQTKAEEYLALANGLTDEYEIALVLHDALVRNVVYDTPATYPGNSTNAAYQNAYNCYGAIVSGRAVCEGYAEAYQYLLQRCGIQSFCVTGTAGEPHEWNLVRLNGNYYYTDVTWDDPVITNDDSITEETKPIFHAYFNIPTSYLEEDHIIGNSDEDYDIMPTLVPTCTRTDMLYKGMAIQNPYDVNEIASKIEVTGNIGVLRVFYSGTAGNDNFIIDSSHGWIFDNFSSIVNANSFFSNQTHVRTTSPCISVGREHYITITCDENHATDITLNKTTLQIIKNGTDTLVATITPSYSTDVVTWSSSDNNVVSVDSNGNIQGLRAGTATITATAGSFTATCTIEVLETCPHNNKVTISAQPSDCVNKGWNEYSYCSDCENYFDEHDNMIPGIPYLPLHNTSLVPSVAATCTTNGSKSYYECADCHKCFEDNTNSAEITDVNTWKVITAKGHQYSLDWTIDTAPTCTIPGEKSHHCLNCGNRRDIVQIDAAHEYEEPVWTWIDNTHVTIVLNCKHGDDTITETADVSDKVIKKATIFSDGTIQYTATFTVNGVTYTDTKLETIPSKDGGKIVEDVKAFAKDNTVALIVIAVIFVILFICAFIDRPKKKKN